MPIPQKFLSAFDYVVGPRVDDFGPFTSGTLTDGLQEALSAAGPGGAVFVRSGTYTLHRSVAQKGDNQILVCEPGVTFLAASDYTAAPGDNGLLSLGQDGVSDFDGFVLQGNGCVFDGNSVTFNGGVDSPRGLTVTGRNRQVFRFRLTDFRVRNCIRDYGIGIGYHINLVSPSLVGQVLVENFDVQNCGGWLRVWLAEHVLARQGRCRQIASGSPRIGLFVTAQHSGTGNRVCREATLEDITGNSNTTDVGGGTGSHALMVEGSSTTTNADVTRNVAFRRCSIRTNPGITNGGVTIQDADSDAGPATVESLTFEDCTFDGPRGARHVGNSSEGYVVYDHCEFLNSADLPGTTFYGGSAASRPLIVRRPVSAVTYPDQKFSIAPGGSPYTYTNTRRYILVVGVSGGSVSSIEFVPRGSAIGLSTGLTAGAFYLGPSDALRIAYSPSAPTMEAAPWY